MANYKLVDADQLDADMTAVAESIRTKGGTTEQLPWPDGFKAAVEAISTGVNVQKKSGRFTTNYIGAATVSNLGFKPDFVAIDGGTLTGGSASGASMFAGAAFEAGNKTKCAVVITPANVYNHVMTSIVLTQESGGFSVTAKDLSSSFEESICANRTLNYVAVKYT